MYPAINFTFSFCCEWFHPISFHSWIYLPLTYWALLSILMKPLFLKPYCFFRETSLLNWSMHSHISITTKTKKFTSTAFYNWGYGLCQQAGQKNHLCLSSSKVPSGPPSFRLNQLCCWPKTETFWKTLFWKEGIQWQMGFIYFWVKTGWEHGRASWHIETKSESIWCTQEMQELPSQDHAHQ